MLSFIRPQNTAVHAWAIQTSAAYFINETIINTKNILINKIFFSLGNSNENL